MSYAQWNPSANYIVADVVLYNAVAYQSIANNTNQIPPASPASWNLFGSGGGGIFQPAYNSFFSNTTQNVPANTETPITYDVASFSGTGVSLVGVAPTPQFRVSTAGVYRIVFSAQLEKTGGAGTNTLEIYFRINGTNVANTNSQSAVNQNEQVIMTVSYIVSLVPTDTVQLVAYTSGGVQVVILAVPANPPRPAVPSIITDVQRIA